jgi:hypothetical protein
MPGLIRTPQWIPETISEEKVTVVWLLVPWALDILLALENGQLKNPLVLCGLPNSIFF